MSGYLLGLVWTRELKIVVRFASQALTCSD